MKITFQIFLLLFVLSACTNEGTESNVENDTSKVIQIKSHQEAEARITDIMYEGITFSPDQQKALNNLLNNYTVEQMNSEPNVRKSIRETIENKILTPEQYQRWLKMKKPPVTIE